jgi:hypothetical protein
MYSLPLSGGYPAEAEFSIESAEAGDKVTETIIDKTQEWCVPNRRKLGLAGL